MTPLDIRRFFAPIAQVMAPGYGRCQHCDMPWKFVDNVHDVPYDPGRAVFFVCEECWPLTTADERVRYVEAATATWDEPARSRAVEAVRSLGIEVSS